MSILAAAAPAAAGCGGSQEAIKEPVNEPTSDGGPRRSSLGVSAEIGALDEGQVKQAFKKASPKIEKCYVDGTQRVPYLAGEVRIKVRVTREGRARWLYVMDSTLGDRVTEDCMLGALKGITWPSPVDGEEGFADSGFSFAPGGDERMPVDWTPEQLGAPYVKEAKPKLAKCRTEAGAGPLKATLYVDTDGKAGAVGVSASDEKGEGAVRCVVDTLSAIKFPSPGSFASKVTVTIE